MSTSLPSSTQNLSPPVTTVNPPTPPPIIAHPLLSIKAHASSGIPTIPSIVIPDDVDELPLTDQDNLNNRSTLKEKLDTIQSAVSSNPTFDLEIRRKRAWLDTLQKLKRAFSKGVRPITVKFVGEEADDLGGPLREFYTVVFEDVKKHLMCSGGHTFTFLHDIEKLKDGDFLILGNLYSLALINGCAGPRSLMPSLVSKLFFQPCLSTSCPTPSDIPDLEIQKKVLQIEMCKSSQEFDECLVNFPERFDCISKANVKFEEKDSFIQNICEHYCISKCSEEILEVIRGMDLFGLHTALIEHFDEIKSEFVLADQLTAQDVKSLFEKVKHSENKEILEKEQDAYYNFTNFIENLEDAPYCVKGVIDIDEEGNEVPLGDKEVSLGDLVQFLSGTRFVLPSMVGKHVIKFKNKCDFGESIESTTCTLEVRIPLNERYCTSTKAFDKNFADDVITGPGYGKP
eukprot:TCONS_00039003-protein